MKEWLQRNSPAVTAGIVVACICGGIMVAAVLMKRNADIIRAAAKAPEPATATVAAPPAPVEPPPCDYNCYKQSIEKSAPVSKAAPKRPVAPTRKPRVGPASSKDCAGLTASACGAKRKATCEAGGKVCVVDPKANWHW